MGRSAPCSDSSRAVESRPRRSQRLQDASSIGSRAAIWPSVTTPGATSGATCAGLLTARREERSKKIPQREYDQSGGDWLREDRGPRLGDAARGLAYRALNLLRRVLDATGNPLRCSADRVLHAASN